MGTSPIGTSALERPGEITPRVVSLIPSATEIVAALGYQDYLVGRSHECDYPASVRALPVCTAPQFEVAGSSGEIHRRVTDLLTQALSVYRLETEVLRSLQPTHIITQAQCEVCAVSLADVQTMAQQHFQPEVKILSLQPTCLGDLWRDLARVGTALGVPGQQTLSVVAKLQERVHDLSGAIAQIPTAARPTVACLEWTEPLMAAGNWIPELVDLAGGISLFGQAGQHSPWLAWADLVAADPDVVIVMPCGYDLPQAAAAIQDWTSKPDWLDLRAVKAGRVYLTDGNAYFNRPGPRLVDSLAILTEILHPQLGQPRYEGRGWQSWTTAVSPVP